jgi:hypothetical protein
VVGFMRWLCVSGYIRRISVTEPCHLTSEPETCWELGDARMIELWEIVSRSPEIDAALVRFNVFHRAVAEARYCAFSPEARDFRLAELELANAHRASTWYELADRFETRSLFFLMLKEQRDKLALAKCLRRKLFSLGERQREKIIWRRK